MLELKKRTRKTKKGLRTIYYIQGTYQGQRIRESLKTDRREAAQRAFERKRAEIIAAIDAGTDRDLKFATAAAGYIESEGEDRFLAPLIAEIGEDAIKDLNEGVIHDLAKRLYPNAKPSTRNRQVITPVLSVINWAARRRLCAPILVERFSEGKVARRAITREWVDRFREAATELGHGHLGDMELFMFTTAARLGDAERLTWAKVDLDAKTATFLTKNGDERVALLTDEMVRLLRPRAGKADGRVFGDWARRQMYVTWKAICAKAGLAYVPPHQAGRHSFATEAIVRNKVDVATAAALGGWKSQKLLLEVYAHPENAREVAEGVFGRKAAPKLKAVK
jgi:integrase